MKEDCQSKPWYKRIDQEFSWSFLGVMLAVIFGSISLFFVFFPPSPNIKITIENQFNIFDVHQPVSEFSVSYKKENLFQAKKNLKVIRIRVENSGYSDLLKNAFDSNFPWAIQVKDGQIVEAPKVTETNSKYLNDAFKLKVVSSEKLVLPFVILESGKFVSFEMLVLHDVATSPEMVFSGKVAGFDDIPINKISPAVSKTQYFTKAFEGGIITNIIRFLASLFCLFILAILIFQLGQIFDRKKMANQKKFEIQQIQEYFTPKFKGLTDEEKKKYLTLWVNSFKQVRNLEFLYAICQESFLSDFKKANEFLKDINKAREFPKIQFSLGMVKIDMLLDFNEDGTITPKPHIKERLAKLIDFIKANPEQPEMSSIGIDFDEFDHYW